MALDILVKSHYIKYITNNITSRMDYMTGYEPYIGCALGLLMCYMGYRKGTRAGIEMAIDGMIQQNVLAIGNNGEITAGSKIK
jgi:hypothetical protein|tara:strand:- start:2598 stop:2846 length:249 start_codon:yes stop_codon:yes gene_type:complete